MTLCHLRTVAEASKRQGVGLGAFNVVQLEMAQVLVEAADSVAKPVILQISQNAVKYHAGHLAPLGLAAKEIASYTDQSVVLHLDHADDTDLIYNAIDVGFTSVMYDGSKLEFSRNVENTQRIAEYCHKHGVSIEAELGEVGGKDGVHAPGVRTRPEDAARFVAATGVDLLAVAVGSSHAMTQRFTELDCVLIERIAEAVPVPLVLHGSSGVSDQGMVNAIKAGITKINVSTHLNVLFTKKLQECLSGNDYVDPRKYLKPSYELVKTEVQRLLTLYSLES